MILYRFNLYIRTGDSWKFTDAFATEETADKKAYSLSLDARAKMIERYETNEGGTKIHKIFYFHKGKYSHQVKREI